MKRFYVAILTLIIARDAWAQQTVSIDDFKRKPILERAEIIVKAPSAQKAELERLDVHLILLQQYGSEEGLRKPKEGAVASARGFVSLNRIQSDNANLWGYYRTCVLDADEKAGMPKAQLDEVERTIDDEFSAETKRIASMHDLVFHLAPSPQASALEKKAALLQAEFRKKTGEYGTFEHPYLSKKDLIELGKKLDGLIEQLKSLPSLTPTQVQKEYDDLPEGRMLSGNS